MNPLRKCISLGGATWEQQPERDNYRFCRNYVDTTVVPPADRENYWHDSRTTWAKFWINWAFMQPAAVGDIEESWEQLNTRSDGIITLLDQEIAQANADGVPAILTVYHAYPPWTSGSTGLGPAGQPQNQKVPSDRDADSPYGWFLSWLLARYRFGVQPNPDGPLVGGAMGNPSGAYIRALIPVNEPNLNMWPQDSSTTPCYAAAMMQTAEALSFFWSQQAPVQAVPTYILGPATADRDVTDNKQTHYLDFTRAVLDVLSGWRPRAYVGWAHHNYRDVELNAYPTRVAYVRGALYEKNWKGGTQNKYIWLTEGGCRLTQVSNNKTTQAARVKSAYNRMVSLSDVFMFTQYGMDDYVGNPWKSHLRDEFQNGEPGPPRPAFWTWKSNSETPAATTPE